MNINKRISNHFLRIALVALVALVALCVYTNVSNKVTQSDIDVFKSMGLHRTQTILTYPEEIALIQTVQSKVFKIAPPNVGSGIPNYESREPADLLRYRHGLCYDRSRTIDKALTYVGFETRHVYLLYRQGKIFPQALFHYGQESHAVSEVKTQKGWLFVDSNTAWIGLDHNNNPVNADDIWKKYQKLDNPPSYLNAPWWAIRGMYSRKGQLYPPYINFPQFNWLDFINWLIKG